MILWVDILPPAVVAAVVSAAAGAAPPLPPFEVFLGADLSRGPQHLSMKLNKSKGYQYVASLN